MDKHEIISGTQRFLWNDAVVTKFSPLIPGHWQDNYLIIWSLGDEL